MAFKPIKNEKVYQLVIEQIRDGIYEGAYKKGDQLPGERSLSAMLEISRAPVREAYRALELLGIVKTRQGEGTFITGNNNKALIDSLTMLFFLEKRNYQELMEVRRLLEVELAIQAAKSPNETCLLQLNEAILRGERGLGHVESSFNADLAFHHALAESSPNMLLLMLYQTIFGVIANFIKEAHQIVFQDREKAQQLIEQHGEIYRAIKGRDPERAASSMKRHMEHAAREYSSLTSREELRGLFHKKEEIT